MDFDFEDLIPKDGQSAKAAPNPFDDLVPAKAASSHDEPADHGLSDRQKLSTLGKAASPITGYWDTYERMNKEAREQISRGVGQVSNPESLIDPKAHGISDVLNGVTNVAAGALGYIGSPISAGYRSVIGQPVEDVTGIPREYTEFAAQLATPGIGLPRAPNAPKPAGFASTAPEVVPAREGIAGSVDRLAEAGHQVDVPKAMASDSMAVQRSGQAIRNVPIVGDAIPKATARLGEQIEGTAANIASEYGGGSGPNVAHKIGQTIGTAAEQEAAAAKAAAAHSDQAVLGAWENNIRGANEAIAGAEAGALQRARQSVGDMSPQDMGETLVARLRAGEQEARATKERLYGIAGESDASIEANAVRNIRKDVSRSLDEQGLFVDEKLTPAAARMIQELDNVPVQNVVSPRAAAGPTPSAPKPTAPKPGEPAPQSLLEFLASKGGLGPDSELEAIGAHGHTVNVESLGRRKLTRQGGLPLDYAREAAEEAGYLRGDHKGTSTVNDLLDAIDAEIRGNKRYAQGYEGTVNKRAGVARSEREQHEFAQHRSGIEDDIAASDFPGDRAGIGRPVSVQGIEQTRKRLNAIKQAADNDADRRAADQVMRAYDDWLDNAFDNALFSGSDEALGAYKQARAANTSWRQRFYNDRDDADKVINRIVTGEVTPQEVSNYIIGSTKVGSKGVSSRLLTRITEATAGDPEVIGAIRGGVWNKLSAVTEGVSAKPGAKVADEISEFFNGSGRDVAQRLFTEPQRAIGMAYARALRQGAEARGVVTDIAANTRPSPMEVGIGPLQRLANDVLGKGSGRSDEALYSAINSYAKSGSKGDISLLSQVVQAIPQAERGNLAGAMIRDMGVSTRTGQFSPDVFVSSWGSYKPEAKSLLFGMTGPQRVALDDIAQISLRMKEVGSKFGNPSGTAQNVNLLGIGAALMASPLTTIAGALGGAVTAKVLSSPIGASSVSKWARVYERASNLPSVTNIESYKRATGLLAINVSRDTGMPIKDIMRQLQGPVPAAAENEKR